MKPRDCKLYNKIKRRVYVKYPTHSAYRSGFLVKQYKREFSKKYGKSKKPYIGNKTRKKGLTRWFAEKWRNSRGQIGYKYKNDIYRPTIKISHKTPKTYKELSSKTIKKSRRIKYKKGRVTKF